MKSDIKSFKQISGALVPGAKQVVIGDNNFLSKTNLLKLLSAQRGNSYKQLIFSGHGTPCQMKPKSPVEWCLALPNIPKDKIAELGARGVEGDPLVLYQGARSTGLNSFSDNSEYFVSASELTAALGPDSIILDSCFSGLANARIIQDTIKSGNKNIPMIISASLSNQYAREVPDGSGGVLMTTLSKIINLKDSQKCALDLGGDGQISEREIGLELMIESTRQRLSKTDLTKLLNKNIPIANGQAVTGQQQTMNGVLVNRCLLPVSKLPNFKCPTNQDPKYAAMTCNANRKIEMISDSIHHLLQNPLLATTAAGASSERGAIPSSNAVVRSTGMQTIRFAHSYEVHEFFINWKRDFLQYKESCSDLKKINQLNTTFDQLEKLVLSESSKSDSSISVQTEDSLQ